MPDAGGTRTEARATIVVVPRERFAKARESLESVFENTGEPFRLVYVDGNSPRGLRRWLEQQASQRGFDLVRRNRYLSPNEARNIGLRRSQTEYVVFLDNDVLVQPGWLGKLIECADETGAALVGPLTCEYDWETIHCAGGEVEIIEERENGETIRRAKEKLYHPQRKVANVRGQLRREQCTLAEYHCVLARREALERIGGLDEEMLNTREHLDVCLDVLKAGGTVWFEPESVVTYLAPPPLAMRDYPLYMLRWSDDWERRSLEHFREKWDLSSDEFFRARLARLGWRRRMSILHPLAQRLSIRGRGSGKVERALSPLERRLNRWVTQRDARIRAREEMRAGAGA
jgi:GT2 family glycosyltransferase